MAKPHTSAERAASPLTQQLEALHRQHPLRTVEVGDVLFRYTTVGFGATGLFLLPGAAGGGEAYLRLVPRLRAAFRMVMVTYPVVSGLDVLLAGLEAMLAAEGIDRFALLGGSFGGTVAQAFFLRHPERVTRVVLSGTVPADPARAVANETWLRRFRFVPMAILRALLHLVVRRLVKNVRVERAFWLRFYGDAISALSRKQLVSQYRVAIDFDRSCAVEAGDMASWRGEMLVLEGARDAVANARGREALKTLYPRARVHTFAGAGHGASLDCPDEWDEVVVRFLTAAER